LKIVDKNIFMKVNIFLYHMKEYLIQIYFG